MNKYENYADEQLLEQLHQGKKDIEEYLIDKYKNLVRKKAHAMYLMGGETDDLIQEGMIGLFRAVRDYQADKDTAFSTFAALCIDRHIYRAIQTSNRQKHQPLNTYISLSEEEEEASAQQAHLWRGNPESILIDQENTKTMIVGIRQYLSPMENQVLELYLDGKGYAHIADILGKDPKSIDNALQRLRSKVREYLTK